MLKCYDRMSESTLEATSEAMKEESACVKFIDPKTLDEFEMSQEEYDEYATYYWDKLKEMALVYMPRFGEGFVKDAKNKYLITGLMSKRTVEAFLDLLEEFEKYVEEQLKNE